jgi:uncharacterized protein (TIGR02186 family)
MIRAAALLLLALLSGPAAAQDPETVVVGLSQSNVSITARFEGSEILVYGAVKRTSPPPAAPPLDVIVTVEGPSLPLTVRKKDRRFGLWVNTEAVRIDAAPSFYAVATTGPLADILTATEDLRHRISVPRAIRAIGISSEAEDSPRFTEALIRIREASGAYRLSEGAVSLTEATLLRTDVALPANLTEGNYSVRIFLLRGGKVVDTNISTIFVRKEGLERWLTNLAHQQPLAYGLLSLLIAVVAGWAASAGFRLIRA